MSIVLTICLALAFSLLIIGHFIELEFICKVIIMSLGFFLILAIRDSFQTYIEDVALTIKCYLFSVKFVKKYLLNTYF